MDGPHSPEIDDIAWDRVLSGSADAQCDFPLYAPVLRAAAVGLSFVVGRIAQSLDGRIATPRGDSFWISGRQDILHTHRLRALCDAVVVGAGTVKADDPRLTTRGCRGPSPTRVVIDPNRRLDTAHHVFRDGPPTLLVCADDSGGAESQGAARVERLPRARDGGLDVDDILGLFAEHGLGRILVEGGGRTVSRFLAAGALDRLHVTVSPLLLGGGVPGFTLPAPARPGDGLRFDWTVHRLGQDVLFDIPLARARPPMCEQP